jgi:transposase
MGKKMQISNAQKVEAVMALLTRSEPAVAIARRFKISEGTLYRLKDEFVSGGKTAINNRSRGKSVQNSECDKLKRDIAQRDEIIANLTVANTVLKKLSEL